MHRRKTILLLSAFLFLASFLQGCGKITPSDPENGWSTQYAMSSTEYSIFVSGEVTVLANMLFTRSSMADSVAAGTYEASKEAENTAESLSKVSSIIDELTVTMPSLEAESDRQNALNLAADAREALRKYLVALNESDISGIKSCAEEMRACMIAAGGTANIPYE